MLLYDKESVYRLDRAAVQRDGLSEIELMHRAGQRVWRAIGERWPGLSRITLFAGSGNNGGDAYVVALLAHGEGIEVQLIHRGEISRQSETSAHYRELWQQAGGDIQAWKQQEITGELIVDGLLGIGLSRHLDDDAQSVIQNINACPAPKVAIDIPSGLNADTGVAQPCAVQAELTVTFIGRKMGQYLADGPDYCGELVFDDLGVSSQTRASEPPALGVIDAGNIMLPARRKRNSYKNQFGHLLIIGGDRGMSGATMLAGTAALRAGAGLVSVLVHPECVHSLSAAPELMVEGWDEIERKLEQADVILVGPGLGQSKAAKSCLKVLRPVNKPLVIDAGALDAAFLSGLASDQVVITPHPGEAAGLLSIDSKAVQADRIRASRQMVEAFEVVSVLKGAGTIVQHKGSTPAINVRGNPGMAVAGMGDVLAGMVAALMAQNLPALEAAKSAVLIHALCAEDFAIDNDEAGLIASDINRRIPRIMKELRNTAIHNPVC
ncbi:MAG: NAD(P)H-hydrate dehydratase [Gammaproteobacteria bacterium]